MGTRGHPRQKNNNHTLNIRSNVTEGLEEGTKRRWGGTGEDQPNPPEDNQGTNKCAKAQERQLP